MELLAVPEPAAQLSNYLAQGVHILGIRKPRLGNSETLEMIRAKGWGMPHDPGREAFEARNLNFQNPDARAWYAQQTLVSLEDGIAGLVGRRRGGYLHD